MQGDKISEIENLFTSLTRSQSPCASSVVDLLQESAIAHFAVDKNHNVIAWNRACETLTGFRSDSMLGTRNQWRAFYPSERPCLADLLIDGASETKLKTYYRDMNLKSCSLVPGAYECEGFLPSLGGGSGRWLRFTAAPVADPSGVVRHVVETLEDITEAKKAQLQTQALARELASSNRKLKNLVLRDPDTGLFNHRFMEEIIEGEVVRAKRYEQPLSLILLDIDYFKSINEVYGRAFGDAVLKQLARELKRMVRRYDMVSRFGGEEFLIISPGIDRFQTIVFAQRLLDELNLKRFGAKAQWVKLKLSLAVVSYPEECIVRSMDLVEIAEEILVKAKEYGGNRVYSSSDVKLKQKQRQRKSHETVTDLRQKIGRLTKRAHENLIESIFAFARTIELKDHYTGEHVERTVYYATQIAKLLNFSKDKIENVRQAAILHDLGKIGISDRILLKAARLTPEEYQQIKKHPQIGADILRPIKFLHSVIPFILYHHERWDGKGYPCGLRGEIIPIGARIISIADVYQALISNRPYRKAFSKEEAMKILAEGSGKQFDPKIVNVFLKILKKNNKR